MPRILIIEDDPKIVEAIGKSFSLEKGFTYRHVSDPARALPAVLSEKPDLILLDIKLPGGDGRQLVKIFKGNPLTKSIPVIFLTGMSSEGDRVLGLNLGADDYVVKPFGAMELLARIHAVLRRTRPSEPERQPLCVAGLSLDPDNRHATFQNKRLLLQPREFEILYLLVSRAGKVLTRDYLAENSSMHGSEFGSRSLDTHIKNVRKKLGPAGDWIETVPKLGYCFNPPQ